MAALVEIYRPWEKPGGLTEENAEEVTKEVMREIREGAEADVKSKRIQIEPKESPAQTSAPA